MTFYDKIKFSVDYFATTFHLAPARSFAVMTDFNVDKPVPDLQSLQISSAPAGAHSEEEVQVLIPGLWEACTKPHSNSLATSPSGPSQPIVSETVGRNERFNRSMTEADNFLAAAHYLHSRPTTMSQSVHSPRYNEEDFFVHARPAHVSASSSTAPRRSLPSRSSTPNFLTGTNTRLNSTRFEAPLFGFSPSPPRLGPASRAAVHLEPDIFALDNTTHSWEMPDHQRSPPRGSQADLAPNHNQRSLGQPSTSSGRSTPRELPPQRRTRLGIEDFIDLTADPTSPPIPVAASTLTSPRTHGSHEITSASVHASKRRKVQPPVSPNAASFAVKDEPEKIEEVDLRDVDDDTSLSKVLEQQRAETVKSQQNDGNQPIKLSSLQCIICMEPMTNITATHCGRSA